MLRQAAITAALVIVMTGMAMAQGTNWSGLYLGVHVGTVSTTATSTIVGTGTVYSTAPSGTAGGLLGGFNWQRGSTVMGLEGEYGGIWNGTPASTTTYAPDGVVNTFSDGSEARLRARVGIADGAWLFYMAGGWSEANLRLQLAALPPFSSDTSDQTHTLSGYNVGTGLEYAFSPHIAGRIEYIFDGFGNTTFVPADTFFSHRAVSNIQDNAFRGTFNFRF